jgi:hypothetical protein
MVKVTAVLLLFLLLTACATPPAQPGAGGYSYDPAVNATIAARGAQDAAATYEAVQRATTVSVQQTAVAAQNATGTVQAAATRTAAVATSTAESLSIQATSIALAAVQTGNAINAQATQIAVVAEQTRLAQEAANIEMARADQQRRLENQRDREEMWNTIIFPALVLVAVLVAVGGIVYAAVYIWRRTQPVIHVTINGRDVPMILDGQRGGYKLLPQNVIGDVLAPPAPASAAVQPEPLPALPEGHVVIAGPTRSGKTTTLLAILQHRQDVVAIDPHGAPGKWGDARMLGAGRNFQEIAAFMQWMEAELNRRAQALAADANTKFPEMTVVADELPAIADELGGDRAYSSWKKWVREGWKFGLYFVFSSQSLQVKPLGLEGEKDILRNFVAAIALGGEAVERYPDLARGMERPAVLRTLRGTARVIIPQVGSPSSTSPTNGYVAPPVINLPNPRSQAEVDGRAMDGVIAECDSLNDVGRVLMDAGPDDMETRPSGQMLRERVRPALAWRINYLSCPDSSRILIGR